MDISTEIFTIIVVHALFAISPGPDFALVSQQTISRGKYAGVLCALGVALGIPVHVFYSSLGTEFMIENATQLLTITKIVMGTLIFCIGLQAICSKRITNLAIESSKADVKTYSRSLFLGFVCNVFNPKAPVYFISLFTVILSPLMPASKLIIYCCLMMAIQFTWFACVSIVLSKDSVRSLFLSHSHWVNRLFGTVMIILAANILLSLLNSK